MGKVNVFPKTLGGIALILVLLVSFVSCGESGPPKSTSTPKPTETPVPTATPAPSVSYAFLLAEREANATRFDVKYKGQYVELDAVVTGIESGNVSIAGPTGFLDDGTIQDLPEDLLIQLDKGMRISAVCKVGSFVFGSMFFDSCILPIGIVQ